MYAIRSYYGMIEREPPRQDGCRGDVGDRNGCCSENCPTIAVLDAYADDVIAVVCPGVRGGVGLVDNIK